MGTRKVEKIASVVIALVVMVLSLFHIADWSSVGIYTHCPFAGRLFYPFFHANIFHAILNSWCLLALVFTYDISFWRLFVAYIVAASMPVDTLGAFLPLGNPTVGLSGIVYMLFGSISFEVARKWYYQAWMCLYIGIGFFFPNTNTWIHLYCYVVGLVCALLNCPFKRSK